MWTEYECDEQPNFRRARLLWRVLQGTCCVDERCGEWLGFMHVKGNQVLHLAISIPVMHRRINQWFVHFIWVSDPSCGAVGGSQRFPAQHLLQQPHHEPCVQVPLSPCALPQSPRCLFVHSLHFMNPFAVSELSSRLNVYTFEATAQQPHSAITECFAFPFLNPTTTSVPSWSSLTSSHVTFTFITFLWVVFTLFDEKKLSQMYTLKCWL